MALLMYLAAVFPALLAWRARVETGSERIGAMAELAALASLGTAMLAVVALIASGPASALLLVDLGWLSLGARLDVISVAMLALVSFIGWIVIRYARRYFQGDPRAQAFLGGLAMVLASVMLLVTAGTLLQLVLAWIATSHFLGRLLLFFPERPAARRAARKKAIFARTGEVALIGAALALVAAFGTTEIDAILRAAREAEPGPLTTIAALLLALAALLKSAQFPSHGWLTEVMETPTPVSALLHAGVVNAGGFLLIRLADVMTLSPTAMGLLIAIGGFTALLGGLVMLTTSAVKTSLAWSTVAQMGFMILQCGFGLFALALLHILAHSLYKAHAFLASGMAIEGVAGLDRPGPVAIPSPRAVLRAFVAALIIFAVMATGFDLLFGEAKSVQSLALGAILIFGVAYLIAQGLADAAPRALTLACVKMSAAAAIAYFTLQAAAMALTRGTLPPVTAPSPVEWVLIALSVTSFGAVALAQSMFPLWAYHPAARGFRVHLANGLYANALIDRLLGLWRRT